MTTIPTGRFVWFDYVAKELAKAQGFFGELFNWKTQEVPVAGAGTYTMILLGEQTIGGYTPTPEGAPPVAHWLSSLQVADAKAAVDKIQALGGKVYKEPIKMGDFGTFAVVADPQGGAFALWQPARVQGSGDYTDAPGAFCWNELSTQDPDKAVAFYAQLGFEVQTMDMPTGAYHVLTSDGKPRAGIMKAPTPHAPQAWMPYVQVKNVDQTTVKAKQLGATICMEPSDIPTVGRVAIFTDPQGGWLGVLAPEKK